MSPARINPGRHARPLRPGETCRPCRVCGVTRCSRKKVNFVARRAAGSTGSGDVDRMASKTVTVQASFVSAPSGWPLSLSTSRRPMPTLILPSGRVDGHWHSAVTRPRAWRLGVLTVESSSLQQRVRCKPDAGSHWIACPRVPENCDDVLMVPGAGMREANSDRAPIRRRVVCGPYWT